MPIEETEAKLRELRHRRDECVNEERAELSLADRDIDEIINITWSMLGVEEPIKRKLFIRQYVRKVEISGEKFTLYYTFRDPRQKVVTTWLPNSLNR